ncbi:MAG: hypothetical protein ACYTEO_19950 [Planctomycetota bacterium]|jgi:hypothetical protein
MAHLKKCPYCKGMHRKKRAYERCKRSHKVKIGRKKKRRSKKSLISLARGAIYGLTLASQPIAILSSTGATPYGLRRSVEVMAGIESDGQFSWGQIQRTYTPVVAWAVVDTVLSKLGVWRKVGRML